MADSVTGQPIAQSETVPAMEDAPTVPVQPFPFMNLPPEIRTMVLKELLLMPGAIMVKDGMSVTGQTGESKYVRDPPPFANVGSEVAEKQHVFKESEVVYQHDLIGMFSASKLIFQEAVPIYFGLNLFHFDDLDAFERFITKLGAEFRWQLARVTITYRGYSPARAVKHLVGCVGLRELTLHIHKKSSTYSRFRALRFLFLFRPRAARHD